jgi:hypothetical protein
MRVIPATGVIERQLVPRLEASHHEVTASCRTRRTEGVKNVHFNALGLISHGNKPEAIVNLLTTVRDRIKLGA